MITILITSTIFLLQITGNVAFLPQIGSSNQKISQVTNNNNHNSLKATSSDTKDDFFAPLKRMFNFDNGQTKTVTEANVYNEEIEEAKDLLKRASETKSEEPALVIEALSSLEKLMRKKCKAEPSYADELLENLCGEWRLIFTTGVGDKSVNYFPIKAVQSFDTKSSPMHIENGIYLGDFNLIRFLGDFEFDLVKRKVEFDFDQIIVLGITINLPKGKAAELGAATGLGSKSNKDLIVKQKKKPFFNWISADESIATARGGGGGLALWKRVV